MWCAVRKLGVVAVAVVLTGCSSRWPANYFPTSLEVKRTLFISGDALGFRETCQAIVVELTHNAANRMMQIRKVEDSLELVPPHGWSKTPIVARGKHVFYESAFGGCNDYGDRPLGDLPGSLERPDAFYKVVNGGEGIAIIVPRAKLAGFYYFG